MRSFVAVGGHPPKANATRNNVDLAAFEVNVAKCSGRRADVTSGISSITKI